MKREISDEVRKRKNRSIIIFVGVFLCAMAAVAVFSACNAVKKYGDVGQEEVEEGLDRRGDVSDEQAGSREEKTEASSGSKEEKEVKGNKNSYERYLEISDPSKITKEHMTEAACYSRKMSEEEWVRYQDFYDRYEEDGLAPKEEMEIVDRMEDSDREVEYPVFEIWNHEYFLPERTLTDEDLLQIVDFQYKLAAAHTQRNEEEKEAALSSPHKVEEDEAMEIADYAIEKMFGVDTSSLDKKIFFNGVASYIVSFAEQSGSTAYTVMIAVGTGRVECITDYLNEYGEENAVEINQELEQLILVNYKKAKRILEDILGSDMEMISSGCQYMTDMSGKEIPEGTAKIIHYFFQLKDDMVYHMYFCVNKNSFDRLSEEEMKNTYYRTREKLEKEGAKKDGDKFIAPLTGAEKEAWGDDLQWIVVPME